MSVIGGEASSVNDYSLIVMSAIVGGGIECNLTISVIEE